MLNYMLFPYASHWIRESLASLHSINEEPHSQHRMIPYFHFFSYFFDVALNQCDQTKIESKQQIISDKWISSSLFGREHTHIVLQSPVLLMGSVVVARNRSQSAIENGNKYTVETRLSRIDFWASLNERRYSIPGARWRDKRSNFKSE